jgi:hypothetical protein
VTSELSSLSFFTSLDTGALHILSCFMLGLKPSILFSLIAIAASILPLPAYASLINVGTSGNLLALLPSGDLNASSEATFGPSPSQAVDNSINTPSQEDGQIFAISDPDQRFAITGFDSAILDIRLYLDPTDPFRFPPSVAIFYSMLSTTSLNSGDSNYTGGNGGILLATTPLHAGSIVPVPGAHSGPIDFFVNAPAGTQTLLFDFGNANSAGDRVSEIQAFASAPEPGSLPILAILAAAGAAVWFRRGRS